MKKENGMVEQVLITSDGMLTRATPHIPHNARARRIVVTAHQTIGGGTEVTVIIGNTGKLTWRSDQPQMERTADGYLWVNGVWIFTDTTTWFTIPFIAGHDDNQGILTEVARTATDASVEQVRNLLNHWMKIRPVITYDVCEVVKSAISGKFRGAQAWRSMKADGDTNG
jgi:hypothetical protein